MVLIVVLIIFVDFTLAQSSGPIRGCAARLLPSNFQQCSYRTASVDCIPFPQLIGLNWSSAKFGMRVLFGQLRCNFRETDLPDEVYFNIYRKKKLVLVVSAREFLKNAHKYVSKSAKCIRILVAGWTSDCDTDPLDVPKKYDWVTFSAESLNCRTKCVVIVFSWGKISGNDYACLVEFMLKPMGNLIGKAIMILDPCRVSMTGHSLGAHICGFAGKYVKSQGGLVKEIAAYDAAGPLIQNNNCLWQVGLFESGMGRDVAAKTISYNTNPRELGTGNTALAHINILCNPPFYNQPGLTIMDPVYNHNYAGMLCAAQSAGVELYSSDCPGTNLNHYDNDEIPWGTYKFFSERCFPFNCYE